MLNTEMRMHKLTATVVNNALLVILILGLVHTCSSVFKPDVFAPAQKNEGCKS